jgi:hypothetical protein
MLIDPVRLLTVTHGQVLSEILTTAYAKSVDTEPSLVLVPDAASLDDSDFGAEPTEPPIADITSYPFLSNTVAALAKLVRGNTADALDSSSFLVADAQTITDKTLLFVSCEGRKKPKTVRLSAEQANAIPVAISVATMDIEGVISIADADGVYRGDSGPPPQRGGAAPPMQLGGGN